MYIYIYIYIYIYVWVKVTIYLVVQGNFVTFIIHSENITLPGIEMIIITKFLISDIAFLPF